MILIWRVDSESEVWTLARLPDYTTLAERGLKANLCVAAPRPFPNSILEITTECEPADFFLAGPVWVVSAALRAVLEAFKANAEFFELDALHNGETYTKKKFYFCNILEAVACFDYEQSTYKTTRFGADGIDKLVLDESKAAGHHLFMLGPISWGATPNPKAICDVIPCASEQLATRIIHAGLTGVVFTAPQDWRESPAPAWKPH